MMFHRTSCSSVSGTEFAVGHFRGQLVAAEHRLAATAMTSTRLTLSGGLL
jgi:hypothetical protein